MPPLLLCSRPESPPSDGRTARRTLAATLLILGLACRANAQTGGGFDLSWSSVGAGGARSSGGGFSMDGLAAPSLAGHAAGGTFTLDGGWGAVTSTIDVPPVPVAPPTAFALLPPRPNPSSSATAIRFDLPHAADVQLAVFDVRGRQVGTLASGRLSPGHHGLTWSGNGADGTRLPSGIYFLRFDADEFHTTSRLVLIH